MIEIKKEIEIEDIKNEVVDVKELRKLLRDFMLWYDGYTRGEPTPIRKLITLYVNIETLLFGKIKTPSWK
ncbi:hypothetical protein LCGC14_0224490 [marine sediment metagenome]|uniref:Uncharacterized protein n=1 Tax=marine sediment metagenome TaxID=412755 RepID=A0A0F9UCG4_9ZZZZ|nr:hypothetical protein [bacterium]